MITVFDEIQELLEHVDERTAVIAAGYEEAKKMTTRKSC